LICIRRKPRAAPDVPRNPRGSGQIRSSFELLRDAFIRARRLYDFR
jgi:hypothetical protein